MRSAILRVVAAFAVNIKPSHLLPGIAILFSTAIPLHAQDPFPTTVTDQNQAVNLPFPQSFGGDVDQVGVENGNLTINIPIVSVKGRGMTYNFGLRYGSAFWAVPNPSKPVWTVSAGNYLPGHVVGWETNQPYATWIMQTSGCGTGGSQTSYNSFIFTDSKGGKHFFPLQSASGHDCLGNNTGNYSYTNISAPDSFPDGIGINTDGTGNAVESISFKNGTGLSAGGTAPLPPGTQYSTGLAVFGDRNGNTQSINPGGTDSIGRTPVTLTNNGSQQLIYSVKDSNGNSQQYTVNLESVAISTDFNTGPQEASGTFLEVKSIQLPNGQSYSFLYDSYGDVTQLTLPSGAQISYTWGTIEAGISSHRYVSSRTATVNGVTSEWQLSIVPPTGTALGPVSTVTDPSQNQQVYSFTNNFATSVKFYSGNATGTPIRQFAIQAFDPGNLGFSLPSIVDTKLENGFVSRKQYTYYESTYSHHYSGPDVPPGTTQVTTSNGDVIALQEYGWGNGAPGPLLRQTFTTYLYQISPGAPSRIEEQDVFDGSVSCASASTCKANLLAKTLNTYDGNNASTTHKGNLTSSARLVSTPSTYWTISYGYDSYGNIISETDPKTNTTNWTYTNQWDSITNTCNPTGSDAYPTTKTDALGHKTSYTWRACTGQLHSVQDPNDLAASRAGTVYGYDEVNNVISEAYPDGGSTTYNYNGYALPLTITATQLASPDPSIVSINTYDGLNRLIHSSIAGNTVDTAYDASGRIWTVSNPHGSASSPTDGTTTYTYDALSRIVLQVNPDSSSRNWKYSGNETITTDEDGNSWDRYSDPLGRLIEVVDPLSMATVYSYNGLDDLTRVDQWGGAVGSGGEIARTFTYDDLSRLTSANNPESGSTIYAYTQSDGSLCSGDSESPCSRTDARGITTFYSYDKLNRLSGKSYSDTTPSVSFGYDADPSTALFQENPASNNYIGRMGYATTMFGTTALTGSLIAGYDPVGRSLGYADCVAMAVCTTAAGVAAVGYQYDLAGNATIKSAAFENSTTTMGTAVGANLQYNSSGLVTSVGGSLVFNALAANPTHISQNLLSAISFDPFGHLTRASLDSINFAQAAFVLSRAYNSRGWLGSENTNSGTIYDYTTIYNPNGTVRGVTDSVIGTWQFVTDPMGRVSNGSASAGPYSGLTISWTYDPFGNRRTETLTGNPSVSVPASSTHSFTGHSLLNGQARSTIVLNNQIDGLSYDAAGNLLNDGTNQYLYDAEERLCASYNPTLGLVTTYLYDGLGNRLAKGTLSQNGAAIFSCDLNPSSVTYTASSFSIADLDGKQFMELGPAANLIHANFFNNGQLLATYDSATSNWYYAFNDWLGTKRVEAVPNGTTGTTTATYLSLPFGDGLTQQGSGPDVTEHHYTGQILDSESGLDYFSSRSYSATMGRFMSPDLLGGYLANPQSLNRYAYVLNNPLMFTDPLGLSHCEGGTGDTLNVCNQAGGMWALDPGDPGYGGSGGSTPNAAVAFSFSGGNNSSGPSSGGSGASPSSGGSSNSFDPNSLAGQLFGTQGLPYWTAANTAVDYATLGTVAFYGGAFFAPEIAAGTSATATWGANATGALGPALNRVFWSGASSGGAAAAAYIAENGGTTLETTPLGRVANFAQNLPFVPQNNFTYSAWAWLSTAYAQGAQGAAMYFEGAQGYQGQIWLNYELPTLLQKGVPIVTVPYP